MLDSLQCLSGDKSVSMTIISHYWSCCINSLFRIRYSSELRLLWTDSISHKVCQMFCCIVVVVSTQKWFVWFIFIHILELANESIMDRVIDEISSSKPQPNSTKHESCAYFFWSILSNISISNSYPRLSSNISEFSEWWKVCKWSWTQSQPQTTRSLAISFLFSLIFPHLSGQQSVHPESTIRTLVSLYTLGRQTVVFVLFWFVYVYGWIFLRLNRMLFTSHTNLGTMTRVLKSLLVDGHFLT